MPAHMTLKKPKKGEATAARRSRKRAADRVLSKNAAAVRERDGHRCRVCGSTERLSVHHLVYRSRGGDHSTGNLVLLCGRCHDDVHGAICQLWGNADVMLWSQRGSSAWVRALPCPGADLSQWAAEFFTKTIAGDVKRG